MQNLPLRAVLAAAVAAILGSAVYYVTDVTWWALVGVGVVAVAITARAPLELSSREAQRRGTPSMRSLVTLGMTKQKSIIVATMLVAIISLAAWWTAIGNVQIVDAVRSPWLVVPPFAIAALGVALFADIMLFAMHAKRSAKIILCAIFFSAISMAAIVYPLGLGFDPFLHRATIAHIAEFGTIMPKPLYYIGQYALELLLVVVGHLPLNLVDRFLLPVFATVALVASATYGFADTLKRSSVALMALMLLPLGAFISTTPQGVAYVFLLCAIFVAQEGKVKSEKEKVAAWLLAIAALMTHPFAGIPAVLYVGTWHALQMTERQNAKRWILAASGIAAVVAIPALFAVQAARSGLALQLHFGNLLDGARWQSLNIGGFLSNHFSTAYDGLYLVVGNLLLLTIIVAVVGMWAISEKEKVKSEKLAAWLPMIFAGAMFANFIALSILFDFDFLISYERTDYAVRALTLTQLFLMPCVIIAIAYVDEYLTQKPRALRMTLYAFLALVGMANVYGAYPRHDNYARSAGFNVSTADFDAVSAITQDAGDENYIVLANQATSAAAVEAYGFKTYYHDDVFYYPIPTGGPLYEKFLTMVNDAPTRATIIEAMDIASSIDTPVDLAYFAVSNYWWKSEIIIENAKREADDWFAVDGGAVTVFIFRR